MYAPTASSTLYIETFYPISNLMTDFQLVAQTSSNLTELSYKVPYRSVDGSDLPVAPVPVKELQEQLSEEDYDRRSNPTGLVMKRTLISSALNNRS
jgi:hypothetical protein